MRRKIIALCCVMLCGVSIFAQSIIEEVYYVPYGSVASNAIDTSVDGLTLTYGSNGIEDWTVTSSAVSFNSYNFRYSLTGNVNPTPGNGNIPTEGIFVLFEPEYTGSITAILSNAGNTKSAYIVEDVAQNLVNGIVYIDGVETPWTSGTPLDSLEKYNGGVTFNVKAGSKYYFYLSGSKMRFNGFIYSKTTISEGETNVDVPNTPIVSEIEGTPLTADMFKAWDSATNPTTGTNVSCEYTLNESTGVIYGDTYLGYLNYANLSGYDQLVVTVSEGTPRFLFNRIVDLGQDADNEAESQMIDIPTQAWGTERYLTVEGNIYTINLRKMVEEKSFAHLHGIKGANWANVTVTSMVLVDNKDFIESQGIIYTENSSNDSYTITSYTAGLPANVVIPAELDGLPVTAIGAEAFADASVLKTLTIPTTVNMVGDKAFSGCHNLMVMEWNATAPMLATCFDAAEAYGNMLVFTNNTDVNFAGNVVVNGEAEKIALTDGCPFRNPQAFTAKRITYTREFSKKTRVGMASGWEGIILPFDVQLIYHEGKGSLAPFGHTASASTLPCWMAEWQQSSMTFVMSKANLANQPFIMEVPNSDEYDDKYNIEGTITFSAENATVHATTDMASATGNGYSLQGTYEGETATGTVYALNDMAYTTGSEYFLPGGVFVANARDIRPFEAYIYNNQLTRSRYLPIQGGKANDMDKMLLKGETNKENDAWYTLQGTRLNGKPKQKGMYIHGNKIITIK